MHSIQQNLFKLALQNNQTQIGLWLGMANSYTAEMIATVGYDWLLIDAEHAPNNITTVVQQLQAIAPYSSHPVVRLPVGDTALIKQYLDIGAQTLLIPMVETAEQARALVAAVHYPPEGVRGVGSALARASLWNNVTDYLNQANQQICLLVQVETLTGVENLAEICQVEGVDGVFIGPADLSASMGYRGQAMHPQVQAVIAASLTKIKQANKAAGILFADNKQVKQYIAMGFDFVAVGVDTSILVKSCQQLLAQFKQDATPTKPTDSVY